MTTEFLDLASPVPELREGLVPRRDSLRTLLAHTSTPIVLVLAGAGYGKTTLLTQWAHEDPRPFVWLGLARRHNDPAVLLAELADALDAVEPIDAATRAKLTSTGADLGSVQLPRLARVLARRSSPFVLVLDDVHLLTTRVAWSVVEAIGVGIGNGSQLALGAREGPELKTGALVAEGRLLQIGAHELAMDRDEGLQVLRENGLSPTADGADLLMERTEGWPVALYLAALALRDRTDPEEALRTFGGDDRLVVDYLRDELFSRISDDTAEFLTRTAILDRLSGPLCDAVLERVGSTETLEAIERANLLIVPLDRRREWYRYHQLLKDKLLARLRRIEPELESTLHARASVWFEANGNADQAVRHAASALDNARFEALVWRFGVPLMATGRSATVSGWLDELSREEIGARPVLLVTAAWCALTVGDMAGVEHWISVGSHATPPGALPDGASIESMHALLRALHGKWGVLQMGRDASTAYALDRNGSPFRAISCLIEGGAYRLSDDSVAARDRLETGVAIGRLWNPAASVQCLGQLALIDIDADDWAGARLRIDEALAVIDQFGFDERPAQSGTYAVAALVHAHQGATADARRELKHALWLLSMLTTVAPWIVAEANVLTARTALLLGDIATARELCREAESVIAHMPDAGHLPDRLDRVQRMCDAETVPLGVSATPITPAEMRVLRYLPTHLTFAAISDELFVSRNTVKTQAIAVYRKLGVSSRTSAVAAARELGLVDD